MYSLLISKICPPKALFTWNFFFLWHPLPRSCLFILSNSAQMWFLWKASSYQTLPLPLLYRLSPPLCFYKPILSHLWDPLAGVLNFFCAVDTFGYLVKLMDSLKLSIASLNYVFKCIKHTRLQRRLCWNAVQSLVLLPPKSTYFCLFVDCFIFGSPESSADLAHAGFFFCCFIGRWEPYFYYMMITWRFSTWILIYLGSPP